MIADLFKKLFDFIGSGILAILTFFADIFIKLGNLLWDIIKWIGQLLKDLFQFLIDLLVSFFEVIFQLIEGLLYLLYMIGVLAIKLFQVIFEMAKLLWSLVQGFGRTLASLNYTPRSGSGNGYSETIGKVMKSLEVLNLGSIAYILLFAIWFTTAITAIKLISSVRVGGD